MSKSTKLHELLPIENSFETQAAKVRADLISTFEKKRHLFEEKRILFTPNAEGAQQVVENQSDLQTTVVKELAWVCGPITKLWDASLRVAEANMTARANIILEDDATPIATDVPATCLLELQKRLAELLSLAHAIPTLDPAKGFTPDSQRGANIFKAREIKKNRTTKQPKVIVKYEATKEHPAQTELLNVDVPVGIIEEQEWSGMMTPAQKSEILDRIEKLSRAVRAARSRANETPIDLTKKIGNDLLNYIFRVGVAETATAPKS